MGKNGSNLVLGEGLIFALFNKSRCAYSRGVACFCSILLKKGGAYTIEWAYTRDFTVNYLIIVCDFSCSPVYIYNQSSLAKLLLLKIKIVS